MKTEEEIRRQLAELLGEYQLLGKKTERVLPDMFDADGRLKVPIMELQMLDHMLDIALARYESLAWVFGEEYEEK